MNRALVSIQSIKNLAPIVGADRIELATFNGVAWQCVVKKGEFKVEDLGAFYEIDSLCPPKPEYDFLKASRYRVKTCKMRGALSQGLCLPLTILPPGDYKEGQDITELLGVTKYEPPETGHGNGQSKGTFPGFLRKTDEYRLQAFPGVLERHRGKEFYISEKCDGQSISLYLKDGQFGVCTRNQELLEVDSGHWKFVKDNGWPQKLKELALLLKVDNVACQGEYLGPGVQGNKYHLTKHELRIFNVFLINGARFLNFSEFIEATFRTGMTTVPILYTSFTLNHTVDELIELSKGNSQLYPTPQEGMVFRPLIEDRDEHFGRLSFKIINNDFLLKHGE